MPIKGFADNGPIPRSGKVYLGVKQVSQASNKEYPVAVDYFVVRADDKATSEAAAKAFHDVYGENPKAIKVMFPSDDVEQFFPQWLKAYRQTGTKQQLYCKGDGVTANRRTEAGWVEMTCPYKECEINQKKNCKELGQLQFFLPDVPMLGVWQLDTTSFHSMSKLNGTINMIKALNGGHIAMIPLTLRVIPMVVSPEGKPKTVYVLQLDVENVKLTDFLSNRPLSIGAAPIVASIPDDEVPEDLFPPSKVIHEDTNNRSDSEERNLSIPIVREEDLLDLSDVGAVADLQIRPSNTGAKEVAKLILAMAETGESFAVVTDDANMIQTLKTLQVGKLVQFKSTQTDRYQMPLLTNLAIVS